MAFTVQQKTRGGPTTWPPRSNPSGLLLLGIHKRHCILYFSGGFGAFASENCSCLCNCPGTRGAHMVIY